VSGKKILFVNQLTELAIGAANAYCVLKKQAGGSPCLRYGLRDVHNKLAQFENIKSDGGDIYSLIGIFSMCSKYEDDFHFTIKLDVNYYSISFFGMISKCLMIIYYLEIWWCLTRHIVQISMM